MDAMKRELLDYLESKRNRAVLRGKTDKADTWYRGIKKLDVSKRRNAIMIAYWYAEYKSSPNQPAQLALF